MQLEKEIRQRLGSQIETLDNNYEIWEDCYNGNPYWLDGAVDKQSLGLCADIPSELARLATIEFETSVTNKTLDKDYQKAIKNIRRIAEYGLALGGIILKPYIENEEIQLDTVTPDMFVVLGFTTFGDINHIAFLDRIRKIERDRYVYYTRLEEHIIKGNKYTINNTAYKSKIINQLGDEIPLEAVEEWQTIKDTDTLDREKPLFAYFKNPQANNLDLRSHEGISCFARALSLIQDADEQYQRVCWEYKGSELAIDADITVLKKSGELPEGGERLFRNLGLDNKDGFYQVFSPQIRDTSLFNGLNEILRKIEFTCGLAYGTLSKMVEVAKTATEIQMSQQRSYSTVVDIQNELETILTDLVEILAFWNKELKNEIAEDYKISFDFDDSIIVDSATEQQIMLSEVAAGILSPEEYLNRRYGEGSAETMLAKPEEENNDGIIEEE